MAGIFNQSFGGGVQTGVTLADKIQERRDRSKLQELADLARGGLGNADIANQIGAGLIGLGKVGPGINAQNVPYNREQQELQRLSQEQQQNFQNELLRGNQEFRERRFAFEQERAVAPELAPGHRWVDPNDLSKGQVPQIGVQLPQPKPYSEVGQINSDRDRGLITPQQAEDAIRALASEGKLGAADIFDIERKLNKDFTSETKDFVKVRDANERVKVSAGSGTPAGDLALIFNYMKVLDPGSVVRESEFATAQSAAKWLETSEASGVPVPRPIANAIRRAAEGTWLSADQRADAQSEALYKAQEGFFAKTAQDYRHRAIGIGANPRNVIGATAIQMLQPVGGVPGGGVKPSGSTSGGLQWKVK